MDFAQGGRVQGLPHDLESVAHDTQDMDETGPNYLKSWRKFRRMTQQQVADAAVPPTTKQVVAALENGDMGLAAKWLRRLAPALGTTPGFLLDHDPNDLDTAWTAATAAVPVEKRDDAIAILRVISGGKAS